MALEKVVPLSSVKRESQLSSTELPLPLLKLKVAFAKKINEVCAAVYHNADDILFQRADKAYSGDEQAAYFDAMRELRLSRKSIEIAFTKGIYYSFSTISESRSGIRNNNPTDTDKLSLLEQDLLEHNVAVDAMINKALEIYADELGHLLLRFQCLLPKSDLHLVDLPIAPRQLVGAFSDALSEVNFDIRAKLVILKLFDKFVVSQLGKFYVAANSALAKQGIMPDLKLVQKAKRSDSEKKQQVAEASSQAGEMFSMLQQVLRARGFSGQSRSGEFGESQVVVESEQILSALSKVQLSQALGGKVGELGDDTQEFSKEHLLLDFTKLIRDIMQTNQSVGYSRVNSDVISLVSMLFEYVLEDTLIPEKMRILIARLQIPMLKTALIDKTFFDVGGHPARQLLNEISRATIGWEERQKSGRDHLYEKIEASIQRVLVEFDSNVAVFRETLEDFKAFIDVDRRRCDLIARRVQDAEEGKVKTEQAQKAVEDVMITALRGKKIPDSLMPLIKDGWQRVMLITFHKEGVSHPRWAEVCFTLSELVWSIDPDTSGADSRKRLLVGMPRILCELREGLAEISFDANKTNRLMSELEQAHVAALQKVSAMPTMHATKSLNAFGRMEVRHEEVVLKSSPVVLNAEVPAASASNCDLAKMDDHEPMSHESKSTVDALIDETFEVAPESGEKQCVALPVPSLSPEVQIEIDKYSVGAWFEFRQNAQSKIRCKLAALIKSVGKYVFINRGGAKVLEVMAPELGQIVQSRQLVMLDDGQIFDRALESIIGGMRR